MSVKSVSAYEPPLPKITPQRTPAGFILTDKSDGALAIGVSIFAVFWLALTLPAAAMVYGDPAEAWFAKAFVSLFVAVGMGLAIFAVNRIRHARKLAAPTLTLDRWPLALGGRYKIRFERRTKDGTPFEKLEGRLRLYESATYRVGTDTRTVTQEIWTKPFEMRACHGDSARGEWQIAVPQDQPPSFEGRNNKLVWEVGVTTTFAGGTDESSFRLLVHPEVVA